MDVSKLPPRAKAKIYCPVVKRLVPITKWYKGGDDGVEDIGNPDVYALVCDEPWLLRVVEKGYADRPVHRTERVPCGEERYCSRLNELWANKRNGKKVREIVEMHQSEIKRMIEESLLGRGEHAGISIAEDALRKGNYAEMVRGLYIAELGQPMDVKKVISAISSRMKEIYMLKHGALVWKDINSQSPR